MKAYLLAIALLLSCATPAVARADDPPPGCERAPIFGLNAQVRKICDEPVRPDGSWERVRQFSYPSVIQTKCALDYYSISLCPSWLIYRVDVPEQLSPVETYIVTPDTIPPGEPGHLD
jgi:hypothetical protein